jgi:hypothetical protein
VLTGRKIDVETLDQDDIADRQSRKHQDLRGFRRRP